MSRRRSSYRSSVVRNWFVVKTGMLCATGHPIAAGERALYRRAGYLSSVLCVPCAKQHLDMDPPERPHTFNEEIAAEDFKSRAGRNED